MHGDASRVYGALVRICPYLWVLEVTPASAEQGMPGGRPYVLYRLRRSLHQASLTAN